MDALPGNKLYQCFHHAVPLMEEVPVPSPPAAPARRTRSAKRPVGAWSRKIMADSREHKGGSPLEGKFPSEPRD